MESLFKQLSDTHATLFVLFFKAWTFHWNVTGPDFYQLHSLFGEQYTQMFEEIDRLGEHMRYLGMSPAPTLSRMVEVAEIEEPQVNLKGQEMISILLEDNEKLIEMLKEISNEAEEKESLATANLVQDLMEAHGSFVYKLRSFKE
jgi:starvation-inducible DNA-binding protein